MALRRWFGWAAISCLVLAAACSSGNKTTTTRTDTEESPEEDGTVADGSSADGSAADVSTGGDASATTADVTDGGAVEDAVADAADDASAVADAGAVDAGSQTDVSKADVPKKVLPLDETCAGPPSLPDSQRCQKCGQCPKQPVCVTPNDTTKPTKTYDNDCFAICDLMAYDGLDKVSSAVPKACDACPFCPAGSMPDAKPWCVKTKSGKSIEVEKECAVKCVPDYAFKADGKTIDYYPGACKTKCSSPVTAGGGGCSFDSAFKSMPVCAKEDGKSYFSACAMQHCDLAGCTPLNETAVSAKCAAKAMTKECDGECWDPKADASCPNVCDAVCAAKGDPKVSSGDKAFHAQSFRNECVAKAHGYQKVGCEGLVWDTNKEKCAATTLYNNMGCLPPVAYTEVTPVCGKRIGKDGKDEFVTFRNIAEFQYFKAIDPNWQTPWLDQKCQMPCYGTCNPCPDASQAVCGDDGLTYESGCLALYYNGDKFNYKPGACK